MNHSSRLTAFLIVVAIAVAVGVPTRAMVEHSPLALTVAEEEGCVDPDVQRLGQEGTKIVFLMECAEGSPVLRGRILCEVDSCRLEKKRTDADS